jgi:amino acid transporter
MMRIFNKHDDGKLGWNATWCMAVGGMVGGGIFSVLGVVVHLAGALAWLSFLFAGLIALATAYSYVYLAAHYREPGGAFLFLRKINQPSIAGSFSWVLIIGYVLTMSVYAYTFGHYLSQVVGMNPFSVRLAMVAIIAALVVVNLLGVGEAAWVEITTVWGKLAVLVGLGIIGLLYWNPANLSRGVETPGFDAAIVGGASIFMGYEGFQLLAYDYHVIRNPERTLKTAVLSAVVAVICVYVLVALGSASLVGAQALVQQKEVSLAVAGKKALGIPGQWLVSLAAVFSTASAINATLFATARLGRTVSEEGELPRAAGRLNRRGIPHVSIIFLGGLAAALAVIGSLSSLVEVASLTFLITFATVNVLAAMTLPARRWIPVAGAAGALLSAVLLSLKLIKTDPLALVILIMLILLAVFVRLYLLAGKS